VEVGFGGVRLIFIFRFERDGGWVVGVREIKWVVRCGV
jgi:hypothetical protein